MSCRSRGEYCSCAHKSHSKSDVDFDSFVCSYAYYWAICVNKKIKLPMNTVKYNRPSTLCLWLDLVYWKFLKTKK